MSEENIKTALQYAVALKDGQEVVHEIDGKNWVDRDKGNLVELEPIRYANTLEVNTLTGLIDYITNRFDLSGDEELLIQVDSPTSVTVLSKLDANRKRESLIKATALLEKFPYGRFQDSEQFIINVQSLIQRDLDAEAILNCAASIRIEGGADLEDNGVSQVVSAKMGAATVGKAEVPNPAELRPYRTFLEVEQPVSPFVFRINKSGECALFEADGGIWKNHAMQSIKEYLETELAEQVKQKYVSIIA